jgi:GntR family transcriptional regulator
MQPVARQAPIAMYEQVKQRLRQWIATQQLKAGDRLPAARELCEWLGVSHQTMAKALDDLDHDGVIYRVQGKGTFVRGMQLETRFTELLGFTESVRRQGSVPCSRILGWRLLPASARWNSIFGNSPERRASYIELTRLRYVDGDPIVLNASVVPEALGRQMLGRPLESQSYYELFAELTGSPVTREDHSISLIFVSREQGNLLNVKPGSAHFRVEGVTYVGNGVPVEWTQSVFRGDRFRFSIRSINLLPERGRDLP